MPAIPCPQCGATARQSRADGRCVSCGKQLPEGLRASGANVVGPTTSSPTPIQQANQFKVVKSYSAFLYLPDPVLIPRLGGSSEPLVKYVQSLMKETDVFWEKAEKSEAKGLLIVPGMKPGKRARVWCEAVDGTISSEAIVHMEKQLGGVKSPTIQGGPIAFALQVNLTEQTPNPFPVIPRAWMEAVKNSNTGSLTLPDGFFPFVWPD